ncbi:hypothetical protein BZA77DRAFT_291846 [Pyronema omphalodes]|nr:hypothetical protein BZA77DRAFT_291846 [Pyronema omphalodes]
MKIRNRFHDSNGIKKAMKKYKVSVYRMSWTTVLDDIVAGIRKIASQKVAVNLAENARNGSDPTYIDSFADNQIDDLRALENLFVGNALRFRKVQACEDTNSLPIADDQIRERLIESIRDGSSVFDMPNTTPLAHWKHRLQKPEILRIADHFLAALKKIHTKGPDESVGGYVFKVRFDTICEVLGRFIDNQINNAKKKRDGKELKRLRLAYYETRSTVFQSVALWAPMSTTWGTTMKRNVKRTSPRAAKATILTATD